jgi:hypothetical protein
MAGARDPKKKEPPFESCKAMAKLKCIEFDAIGLPNYLDNECTHPHVRSEFDCPTVSENEDEIEGENVIPHQRRKWTEIPTFSSTAQFFEYWIDRGIVKFDDPTDDYGRSAQDNGRFGFLRLFPGEFPSSYPDFLLRQSETFSLAHDDLNFQIILCDEYGSAARTVGMLKRVLKSTSYSP